ncbi:hypothetical protein B0T20DRAFT_128421 [Sordaria brevicollis]|uniref:Uncharacterized protein n=1 Tax=Sordaria brevicollis TaxID=83679 RepID=A0AAE0PL53_SORBR|nr:hypothetical protein B0T20DRAFT_128421 [Sordaria brevicollis]
MFLHGDYRGYLPLFFHSGLTRLRASGVFTCLIYLGHIITTIRLVFRTQSSVSRYLRFLSLSNLPPGILSSCYYFLYPPFPGWPWLARGCWDLRRRADMELRAESRGGQLSRTIQSLMSVASSQSTVKPSVILPLEDAARGGKKGESGGNMGEERWKRQGKVGRES